MGVKYFVKNLIVISFKKILVEGIDFYMNMFWDILYLIFFGFSILIKIGIY